MNRIYPFILISLLLLAVIVEVRDSRYVDIASIEAARTAAVKKARAGHYAQVLSELGGLIRLAPQHQPLYWDKIVILTWDRQYQAALDLAAQHTSEETPDWVEGALRDARVALMQQAVAASASEVAASMSAPTPAVASAFESDMATAALARPQAQARPVATADVAAIAPTLIAPTEASIVDRWLNSAEPNINRNQPDPTTLQAFADQLAKYPNNTRLRGDYIVLLLNAGKPDEAWNVAHGLPLGAYPSYVHQALGEDARRRGDTAHALEAYRAGYRKYPRLPALAAGVIMSWADRDETLAQAEQQLAHTAPDLRKTPQVMAAEAYLYKRQGNNLRAANRYRQLRQQTPNDAYWVRQEVFSLADANLPYEAAELAGEHRKDFSDFEWATLLANRAAFTVRVAFQHRHDSLHEHWQAQADKHLQASCAAARASGEAVLLRRCAADEIESLVSRGKHRDAVDTYEKARADKQMPGYVKDAIVESYLALHQLDKAIAIRADAVNVVKGDFSTDTDVLFAAEQHEKAEQLLIASRADNPAWVWSKDGNRYHQNLDRLDIEQNIARAESFDNRLDEAQQKLEAMVAQAPRNTSLRLQLAQLYGWRGWPRLAEQQYKIVAALEPHHVSVHQARINVSLSRGAFADAREEIDDIKGDHVSEEIADALEARRKLLTGPYLYARIGKSWSNGANRANASEELVRETYLYSPAWTRFDDTRLFVFRRDHLGKFDTERATIYRNGFGLQTRHRYWRASASMVQRQRNTDGSAVNVDVDADLSDHWWIFGAWQGDSDATPLRAAEADIDVSSLSAGVRYSVEAGHYYQLSAKALNFDDGNRGKEINLNARQPLYRNSPHEWALLESLSLAQNSNQNTPYFSPESSTAATLHAEYIGDLYVRFSRRWQHRLLFGGGVGSQKGFGANPMADITYEHRLLFGERLELNAGSRYAWRTYDGDAEQAGYLYGSLLWRMR